MGGAASKIQNTPYVTKSLNEAQVSKPSAWQAFKDNLVTALAWVGASHGGSMPSSFLLPTLSPAPAVPTFRKSVSQSSMSAFYIIPSAMISGDYGDSPTPESHEMHRMDSMVSKVSNASRSSNEMTIWDLPPM